MLRYLLFQFFYTDWHAKVFLFIYVFFYIKMPLSIITSGGSVNKWVLCTYKNLHKLYWRREFKWLVCPAFCL